MTDLLSLQAHPVWTVVLWNLFWSPNTCFPTGFFEPYQPYEVSVYPRFKDAIGHPKTATAYSRQKGESQESKTHTRTDRQVRFK